MFRKISKCVMGAVHVEHVSHHFCKWGRRADAAVGAMIAGPSGVIPGGAIGWVTGALVAIGIAALYAFSH